VLDEGAQQAVNRGLGEADARGDLGHPEPGRTRPQHVEDDRGAFHGLDHGNLSIMPNEFRIKDAG
jgi:hypothetical protein